jgi:iron complex transport system ATP-binding protein
VIGIGSLTVHLGGNRVVDDVGLTVVPAEWTTVIGRNGAGKTTLLRAVAGLVPYVGSISVDGRQIREMAPRERARVIALVPQNPLLPADMTVREYALLGRTPHLGFLGRPGRHDDAAAQQALDSLDLGALAGRRLDALSGGEQQRVVLARALAQQAPILLLDEPTTSLDVGRQQEVLDLVWALRSSRNLTVLGAMHDLTLAGQYADRLVLMDAGRVVADGTPAAVLTEERINRHYDAHVRVSVFDGSPVVLPARRPSVRVGSINEARS